MRVKYTITGSVLFVLVFLFFLGCHKKSDPSPSNLTCYITSVTNDSVKETGVIYDSQNRLIQINYYNSDGTIGSYAVASYDANNRLSKVTTYDSTKVTSYNVCTYNADNTLAADTFYSISNNSAFITEYDSYTYNSSMQVVQITTHILNQYNQGPMPGFTVTSSTYSYNSAGNVEEENDFDANNKLTAKIDYTYDNYPNFISSKYEPGDPSSFSKNNVLTAIETDSTGNVVTGSSYTATYTYNSENYVITSMYKDQDGSVLTESITYNCH